MKLALALAYYLVSVYGGVLPYQGPIEIAPGSELLVGPAYGISSAVSFVPEVPPAQPATTIVSGPSAGSAVVKGAASGPVVVIGASATGRDPIADATLIPSADDVGVVKVPTSGPVLVQGPSTGPIAIVGPKEAVTTITAASTSGQASFEASGSGITKASILSNGSKSTEEGRTDASTSSNEDESADTTVAQTSGLPTKTIITGASAASAGSVASSAATVIGPSTGPVLLKPPISAGSGHSNATVEAKFTGTVVAGPTAVAATIKGPTSEAVLLKEATSSGAVNEGSAEALIITDGQQAALDAAKPVISLDSSSVIPASSYADTTATLYAGERLNHVAVPTAAVRTTLLLPSPSGTIRAEGASLFNAKKRLIPVLSKW